MNDLVLRGVVHGNVIELERSAGRLDGEPVEVIVRRTPRPRGRPGDGFRRTEGALADDEEWDAIMDSVARDRRLEPRTPGDA